MELNPEKKKFVEPAISVEASLADVTLTTGEPELPPDGGGET